MTERVATMALIGLVTVGAIVAITLLRLFAPTDTIGPTVLVAFLGPTVASLLAYLKAQEAKQQIEAIHLEINSRLTQLLELTDKSARAEGRLEGKEGT